MSLHTVEEIERAIEMLNPEEIKELYAWLEQNPPDPLDARVQVGLDAGHLDQSVERALADEKSGRVQPL